MRDDAEFLKCSYEALFDRGVAGIIVTNADGQILDCNELCAKIFGFNCRDEMLKRTAWDLYFDRSDRETMIQRLRKGRLHEPELIWARRADGSPVWLLTVRTALQGQGNNSGLFQGSIVDITQWKTPELHFKATANANFVEANERLDFLLESLNLSPKARTVVRCAAETRRIFLTLEEIKMLLIKLEVEHVRSEA